MSVKRLWETMMAFCPRCGKRLTVAATATTLGECSCGWREEPLPRR